MGGVSLPPPPGSNAFPADLMNRPAPQSLVSDLVFGSSMDPARPSVQSWKNDLSWSSCNSVDRGPKSGSLY